MTQVSPETREEGRKGFQRNVTSLTVSHGMKSNEPHKRSRERVTPGTQSNKK